MLRNSGFTLIELIVVLVVLGVLSAVAIPKFINLRAEARISVLNGIMGSAKSANQLMNVSGKLNKFTSKICPNFSPPGRIIDVYLDERTPTSGDCPGGGSIENDDNLVRLIWGWSDNTHVEKIMTLNSEDVLIEYDNPNDTYFGYDLDGDGNVRDDNCYFRYVQAQNDGDSPDYSLVSTGCN